MRKTILPAAATILSVACATVQHGTPAARRYDVVITHGRIVDGTGNPWFRGDVAITHDRIVAVAPHIDPAGAARVIDAHDMIVAPGFIDMLGHSEHSILNNPHAVSKVTQGITSEITGEVESAWPNTVATAGATDRTTSAAAASPPAWNSLDGYFHFLEANGSAINLGTYVAAGSVRRAVIGDASRHPTAAELQAMGSLVDSAMRDGAMGFSTGLIYPPSTFFSTGEIETLTRYAARYGGGYASHIRSEGDSLLPAIREAIRIGTGAGTWIQIRHLKSHSLPQMQRAIALLDSARRAGVDVTADQYPYTASGTGLSSILPAWVQAGGTDSMIARLRDPAVRRRLHAMHDSSDNPHASEYAMVNEVHTDSLRQYEGKRLDEIGRMRNEDPYDAAYDILVADRGATSAIYFSWNEQALRLVLQQPWVAVGQDAGAATPDSVGGHPGRGHPRAFGTFPRILGRYVREDSVLTLEAAIRKMTSLAAQRVGLLHRGLLLPGMYADVVVFDPATVLDRATYETPRLLSTGIEYVLVNGVAVVDAGHVTAALPGRALRGPGYRRGGPE